MPVTDIITNVVNNNPEGVKTAFEETIQAKITEVLATKKQDVARNLVVGESWKEPDTTSPHKARYNFYRNIHEVYDTVNKKTHNETFNTAAEAQAHANGLNGSLVEYVSDQEFEEILKELDDKTIHSYIKKGKADYEREKSTPHEPGAFKDKLRKLRNRREGQFAGGRALVRNVLKKEHFEFLLQQGLTEQELNEVGYFSNDTLVSGKNNTVDDGSDKKKVQLKSKSKDCKDTEKEPVDKKDTKPQNEEVVTEGTHYHSVFAKGKGEDRWAHHFDADSKDDASAEVDSLKNQGHKTKVLKVPKKEANWGTGAGKTDPHAYVTGATKKLGEEYDALDEVTPPGFEKIVKKLKGQSGVDNPWAVAWAMKNKGVKPKSEEVEPVEEKFNLNPFKKKEEPPKTEKKLVPLPPGHKGRRGTYREVNVPIKKEDIEHLISQGFKLTEQNEIDVNTMVALLEGSMHLKHHFKNMHGDVAFIHQHKFKGKTTTTSHIPYVDRGYDSGSNPEHRGDARPTGQKDHDCYEDAEKELKKCGYTYSGHITADKYEDMDKDKKEKHKKAA